MEGRFVNRELDYAYGCRDDRIIAKPHVKLESANWHRDGKWHTEWRCSVSWFKSRGFLEGGEGGFYWLEGGFLLPYSQAYSLCFWWAKQLGIPFVKAHGNREILVWVRIGRRTNQQVAFLDDLLKCRNQREVDKLKNRIEQEGRSL